jgi:hypothetical protein
MNVQNCKTPCAGRYWVGGAALTRVSISLLLSSEGLETHTWQGEVGEVYHLLSLPYQRILWVAQGSLIVNLPLTKQKFILHKGDRLDLLPNIEHLAIVGPVGVICVEARRL